MGIQEDLIAQLLIDERAETARLRARIHELEEEKRERNRKTNSSRTAGKQRENSSNTAVGKPEENAQTAILQQSNSNQTSEIQQSNSSITDVVNGDLGATNPLMGFVSPLNPPQVVAEEALEHDDPFALPQPVTAPLAPASSTGNSQLTTSIDNPVNPPQFSALWKEWPAADVVARRLISNAAEPQKLQSFLNDFRRCGRPDVAKAYDYLAQYFQRAANPSALLDMLVAQLAEGVKMGALVYAVHRAGDENKLGLSVVLPVFVADAMSMPGIAGFVTPASIVEPPRRAMDVPVVTDASANVDWRSMLQS